MLVASVVLMMIPHPIIVISGISLFLVVFIATYIYRFQNRGNEIIKNYYKGVTKVIWQSSLILLVGVLLFGCIVYFNGDLSPVDRLMAHAQKGVIANPADIAAMQIAFINLNKELILLAAFICLLPYPAFVIVKSFLNVKNLMKKEG
jgi:hypothetical protein